jgi:hypothetical protein
MCNCRKSEFSGDFCVAHESKQKAFVGGNNCSGIRNNVVVRIHQSSQVDLAATMLSSHVKSRQVTSSHVVSIESMARRTTFWKTRLMLVS